MQPLSALAHLRDSYRSYVDSFQFYRNPVIADWVQYRRAEGRLSWREPFLTIAKPFAAGEPLESLVAAGLIHKQCLGVFSRRAGESESGPVEPYEHQSRAVRQVLAGHNTAVTTGTGSGKSLTFYLPIVSNALGALDRLRTEGRENTFRTPVAVVVYPMNTLSNSQYEDLVARLAGTGLRVCNYTGDLRHSGEAALADFALLTGREKPADCEIVDRAALERFGADILLTNFKMLEYALVQRRDARLFTPLGECTEDGAEGRLSYLVLDELHTYSGRQGADMALLVRRFRQRTATMGRLRCIATSATLDTTDPDVAAATIADFATELFGEVFEAAHVVAEVHGEPVCLDPADPATFLASQSIDPELVRRASQARSEAEAVELLGPALCGTTGAPDPDVVRATRPVAWVERALWDGVRSLPELAEAYVAEVRPGLELSRAADEVEAAFVLASMTKVDGPRGTPVGLLTPKVHAFFSQGLPVTGCLRTDPPHLSEVGSGTCLACAEQGAARVTAYPMVFCAACGQEFFVAVRRPRSVGVPPLPGANRRWHAGLPHGRRVG